jgi:hypothetical protein
MQSTAIFGHFEVFLVFFLLFSDIFWNFFLKKMAVATSQQKKCQKKKKKKKKWLWQCDTKKKQNGSGTMWHRQKLLMRH